MSPAGDGIDVRHRKGCRSHEGGRCNCTPGYRAGVYDAATRRQHHRTFATRSEARLWRLDAIAQIRAGVRRTPSSATVREAAERRLRDARAGVALTRSGEPYKPSSIRNAERALKLRVLPAMGDRPFAQVRRGELQRLVNRVQAEGANPSTIGTTIMPLRAMYRDAIAADELDDNPTRGLRMPAVRGRRERYADQPPPCWPPSSLRSAPLWVTALYAGLRRGELIALRWEDVDLPETVIRVRRGWDAVEGEIAPKSAQGRLMVPIPAALRSILLEQRIGPVQPLDAGQRGGGRGDARRLPRRRPGCRRSRSRSHKPESPCPIGR